MGSTSKELREKQLKAAVAKFDAFKVSFLKDKDLSDKEAMKNTTYRQLNAEVKRARKRILAIDERAAHVETIKAKATKAAKVAKPKKKADTAAPKAEKPGNKNKKKKK